MVNARPSPRWAAGFASRDKLLLRHGFCTWGGWIWIDFLPPALAMAIPPPTAPAPSIPKSMPVFVLFQVGPLTSTSPIHDTLVPWIVAEIFALPGLAPASNGI